MTQCIVLETRRQRQPLWKTDTRKLFNCLKWWVVQHDKLVQETKKGGFWSNCWESSKSNALITTNESEFEKKRIPTSESKKQKLLCPDLSFLLHVGEIGARVSNNSTFFGSVKFLKKNSKKHTKRKEGNNWVACCSLVDDWQQKNKKEKKKRRSGTGQVVVISDQREDNWCNTSPCWCRKVEWAEKLKLLSPPSRNITAASIGA